MTDPIPSAIRGGSLRFLIPIPWIEGGRYEMERWRRSLSSVLALTVAAVVLSGCFSSAPTTKAALCETFDALGKELLTTHILNGTQSVADVCGHPLGLGGGFP